MSSSPFLDLLHLGWPELFLDLTALIVLALVSFGLTAVVQAMFPLWTHHSAAAGLRVHLTNGFYANAVFDRLLRRWAVRNAS